MDVLKVRDKENGGWASIPAIKGDKGDTPKKGTDYWTVDDQKAIVNDVLAAMPTWEGGSY